MGFLVKTGARECKKLDQPRNPYCNMVDYPTPELILQNPSEKGTFLINPSCYLGMKIHEIQVKLGYPDHQQENLMDTQIIVVFCLCADMLKSLRHYEDSQSQMSDAEVMTTAIIAMLYFRGNFSLASRYLFDHRYIPGMLSASRFNRRLHRIADLFLTLFLRLGETWKKLNEKSVYVIDSYPIAVCDNYRIKRSKIYHGEAFRGYLASKKRYFYLFCRL
jgi:hypothetical protein